MKNDDVVVVDYVVVGVVDKVNILTKSYNKILFLKVEKCFCSIHLLMYIILYLGQRNTVIK
jgi:hypothetical protein